MTEKQLPVSGVAALLGVSVHSLYAWINRYTKPKEQLVMEEQDILEKCPRVLYRGVRLKCGFIKQLSDDYSIRRLHLKLRFIPAATTHGYSEIFLQSKATSQFQPLASPVEFEKRYTASLESI